MFMRSRVDAIFLKVVDFIYTPVNHIKWIKAHSKGSNYALYGVSVLQ